MDLWMFITEILSDNLNGILFLIQFLFQMKKKSYFRDRHKVKK